MVPSGLGRFGRSTERGNGWRRRQRRSPGHERRRSNDRRHTRRRRNGERGLRRSDGEWWLRWSAARRVRGKVGRLANGRFERRRRCRWWLWRFGAGPLPPSLTWTKEGSSYLFENIWG